jgi:hypothetical protein
MPLTLSDLKAVVESKQFDKLVGEVESESFDAKGQPYQFNAGDHVKREFAKDITAFANAGGGYIFLGVATKQTPVHPGDEVFEVRPFAADLIDPSRHYQILAEWTHPEPKGVTVEWIPFGAAGKGIGVITIPPQSDRTKPFLITKSVDTGKTTETLLGYAERKRDTTDALSVVELQHALQLGMNFAQGISDRLDSVERVLESFFRTTADSEAAVKQAEVLTSRIDFALKHGELHKTRVLILAAYPTESTELKTLFSKQQDSLRQRVKHPPELRYSGWDLGSSDQVQSIEGKLVRSVEGQRKVLDVYRDGCLIFAAPADSSFLAWASNDGRRLNPIALIEVVTNFLRFYSFVLNDMRLGPSKVVFHIQLRNLGLDGIRTYLPPYGVNSIDFRFGYHAKEAPTDNCSAQLTVEADAYDPDRIAYELVRELYLWFGHEEEVIPYTKAEDGISKIDVDQIINSQP